MCAAAAVARVDGGYVAAALCERACDVNSEP